MARVKSRDTKPELSVRKLLTRLGFRYRLHRRDLPGSPDIVFVGRRKAVFVHGCFWHGHSCARGARVPRTNADYWRAKIDRNAMRDMEAQAALLAMGWSPFVIWKCELRDSAEVERRLTLFLD